MQKHYGVDYTLLARASAAHTEMTAQTRCPVCRLTVYENELKDDSAVREFRISGMCQDCQDIILREV